MGRRYLDGDSVMFSKKDFCLVDAKLYDGTVLENLEARRLFPVSGRTKYITLLDNEGKEQAIIRDVMTLMPESRDIILECLDEYYLVPKIIRLLDVFDKKGTLKWTVETDCGIVEFQIRNRHTDIKVLFDGRVLVRDTNDNRYEIVNHNELDKHSKLLLNNEL